MRISHAHVPIRYKYAVYSIVYSVEENMHLPYCTRCIAHIIELERNVSLALCYTHTHLHTYTHEHLSTLTGYAFDVGYVIYIM